MFRISELDVPIIAAPMAGGPTTPALVAAVCSAGGTGLLAAGYRSAADIADQLRQTRTLTDRPFGVNLFVPNHDATDTEAVGTYRDLLQPIATDFGAGALPSGHPDDDDWDAKLAVLQQNPVEVVSFTFGIPGSDVIDPLRAAGTFVMATVTSPDEARTAVDAGYDALVVQGPEAGGHRGTSTVGQAPDNRELPELLRAVRDVANLPLIAAGGLSNGETIAEALALSDAVQLGTSYLLADEAGTSRVHRASLKDPTFTDTAVSRCFTGRPARGLLNEFMERFDEYAVPYYPAVHQVTAPLRKASAAADDPHFVHLWAGTGWQSIESGPAAAITAHLWAQTQRAQG